MLRVRIGHYIFDDDLREPYQIVPTLRVKIRAVTGPMCLNSCNRAESSDSNRHEHSRIVSALTTTDYPLRNSSRQDFRAKIPTP